MNPYGSRCQKCGSLKTIAIIHSQWHYICPKCDMDNGYVILDHIDEAFLKTLKIGPPLLENFKREEAMKNPRKSKQDGE